MSENLSAISHSPPKVFSEKMAPRRTSGINLVDPSGLYSNRTPLVADPEYLVTVKSGTQMVSEVHYL